MQSTQFSGIETNTMKSLNKQTEIAVMLAVLLDNSEETRHEQTKLWKHTTPQTVAAVPLSAY